MHLGHTDTTKPGQMKGADTLIGFSRGGYSSYLDIFDAVYKDAEQNNSMFGLERGFQNIYEANSKLVSELTNERILGFEALRFKDVARTRRQLHPRSRHGGH